MNNICKIKLDDLSQFLKIGNLHPYIFRGQANTNWDLSTSLERMKLKYKPIISDFYHYERWMLRDFKKKYIYTNTPLDSHRIILNG